MSHASNREATAKTHLDELRSQATVAATQTATAHSEKIKSAAAGKVEDAAAAADAAAAQLDPHSPQAQAVNQVADQIERVAAQLRTADVNHWASEATDMARRNPILFIGAAAFAGFAVARFLKARDPQPDSNIQASDPWTSPYAGSHATMAEHRDTTTVMAHINGERKDV